MTVDMSVLLLVVLVGTATAAVSGDRTLRRRFRRPRSLQVATVAAALVLVPATASTTGPGGAAVTLVATVVALSGVAGLGYALRIPAVPARLPRQVLAIGAHPDDLELACGGTLVRLVDSGHEVHVLVMTRGERGGDAATRAGEAAAGARFVGVTSVEVLDHPDTLLATAENAMAEAIDRAIRRHRPDIVFTHSANDHHQDHRAVHAATLRAARCHPAVLCYESPSATSSFRPTVFVDIGEQLDAKIGSVAVHRDQRAKPYVDGRRLRALAAFRGGQGRVDHAEGFEAVRVPAPLFEDGDR
ncbi:PIG-L deacetylase family protein [Asanoa iriomotensis]|uniref:PIG-L deacetylase family protein n=1 Tax=Asanoa iriomotensis TaxID=234613 RepID=UPI0031DB4C75